MPRRAILALGAVRRSHGGGPPGLTRTSPIGRTSATTGGTDATIASCNSDAPDAPSGGERQQNEPTAAVNRST